MQTLRSFFDKGDDDVETDTITNQTEASKRIADGVIEHLSIENAELREHNTSLMADVVVYREVAQASIAQNVHLTAQLQQVRREIRRLRKEHPE
ncbi:MAG TPA: hypothetical protein VLV86_02405 [Vicinamibacterales bacterium]|nr:hypothetical protein [Vicinamibacterales bacterium]